MCFPWCDCGISHCIWRSLHPDSIRTACKSFVAQLRKYFDICITGFNPVQGILLAMAIFFIGATMAVVERLKPAGSTKSYLLYKRGSNAQPKDEEDQISKSPSSGRSERTAISDDMKTGKTTLSWRKLNYHVNGLHLLKDVEGYVRPGELCALSKQTLIKNFHVLIVISCSWCQWCCTIFFYLTRRNRLISYVSQGKTTLSGLFSDQPASLVNPRAQWIAWQCAKILAN